MNDVAEMNTLLARMARDSLEHHESTERWIARLDELRRVIDDKIKEDRPRRRGAAPNG